MYELHWGLSSRPFREPVSAAEFFDNPHHEEALARLDYLIESAHRVGLLLGPRGSGKSLLLEVLACDLRRSGHLVTSLSLLALDGSELPALIAQGWGLSFESDTPPILLWRMLADRAVELRLEQVPAVVLCDDADRASHDALLQVARLARLEAQRGLALSVVLCGSGALLQGGGLLLDLAELRVEVEPWNIDTTDQYLRAALARAGRKEPAFHVDAVARLHQLSGGLPRRVRHLADLCLLAAAGEGAELVDESTVDAVHEELAVREPQHVGTA